MMNVVIPVRPWKSPLLNSRMNGTVGNLDLRSSSVIPGQLLGGDVGLVVGRHRRVGVRVGIDAGGARARDAFQDGGLDLRGALAELFGVDGGGGRCGGGAGGQPCEQGGGGGQGDEEERCCGDGLYFGSLHRLGLPRLGVSVRGWAPLSIFKGGAVEKVAAFAVVLSVSGSETFDQPTQPGEMPK